MFVINLAIFLDKNVRIFGRLHTHSDKVRKPLAMEAIHGGYEGVTHLLRGQIRCKDVVSIAFCHIRICSFHIAYRR